MSPHACPRVDDRTEVASPSMDEPVASQQHEPPKKGGADARRKPWEGPTPIKTTNDDNGPRNG